MTEQLSLSLNLPKNRHQHVKVLVMPYIIIYKILLNQHFVKEDFSFHHESSCLETWHLFKLY